MEEGDTALLSDVKIEIDVAEEMPQCWHRTEPHPQESTRLREKNPHLLDISGDTVHIVANAAKALFKPFDGYLENISSDIYYDLEKSPKAKDLFQEVQVVLGQPKGLHIIRPCPSRFLQMLQVCDRISRLIDSLRVYYFSFLSTEEQEQYRPVINRILESHAVSSSAAARIRVIQIAQAKQSKTSSNLSRKDRILTGLFKDYTQFQATVDLYRGLLKKLESYTKLLQSEKPVLHIHHELMFSLVQKFLMLFLQANHVPETVKGMVNLKEEVRLRSMQVADGELCVGEHCHAAFTKGIKQSRHWAADMAGKLREGFGKASFLLLDSLPLDNSTIIQLSCLNPAAVSDPRFGRILKKLATSLPNVITEEQRGTLDSEARDYAVDKDVKNLAASYDPDSDTCRLDVNFWSLVFRLKTNGSVRFPMMMRLIKALLSIFSGPLVESSFNTMDDCIRKDRVNLLSENYEAVAMVRSSLKSKQATATTLSVTPGMISCVQGSKGAFVQHSVWKRDKKKKTQTQIWDAAVEQLKKKSGRQVNCLPNLTSSAKNTPPATSTSSSAPARSSVSANSTSSSAPAGSSVSATSTSSSAPAGSSVSANSTSSSAPAGSSVSATSTSSSAPAGSSVSATSTSSSAPAGSSVSANSTSSSAPAGSSVSATSTSSSAPARSSMSANSTCSSATARSSVSANSTSSSAPAGSSVSATSTSSSAPARSSVRANSTSSSATAPSPSSVSKKGKKQAAVGDIRSFFKKPRSSHD
ncbi:hypothetical protein V1264_022079 [Littorina saxatilis]|uniref:Uncharacterized protein n=1 Tax=Littorina saxatilis TaxID=31220 RepID=A0AAN9AJU8_9CAEN